MASDDILELNTLRHYDRLGCNEEKRQMYEVGLSLDNLDEPERERISKMHKQKEKERSEAELLLLRLSFTGSQSTCRLFWRL